MSGATAQCRIELRVCDATSALAGLASKWNELVDASVYPNVFLRWEWISTWWRWFGANRRLHIVTASDGDALVGVLPLYESAAGLPYVARTRKLSFIGAGGPTCPEYLGPIVHRDHLDAVTREFAEHLRSRRYRWDVIDFLDVPPDDPGTNALIRLLVETCATLSEPGQVCPYIELPRSYDALMGRLSGHTRRRRKWQVRRAARECAAEMSVLESAEAFAGAFAVMAALSASSRARLGQPSPFDGSDWAGFHREVIREFSRSGIVKVHFLSFHGRPVAFIYGFLYHGKFCSFQTGFDGSEGKFSPGDVLHQMSFDHLIAEGVSEFDFLRGAESYKTVFANGSRWTQSTWVYRQRGVHYFGRWLRLRVAKPLRRWAKQRMANVTAPRRPPQARHASQEDEKRETW